MTIADGNMDIIIESPSSGGFLVSLLDDEDSSYSLLLTYDELDTLAILFAKASLEKS
jgi:hypothetical protein